MKDLEGRITLITGAASGIGRLMARKFADEGAILVLWDIRMDLLQETKDLILTDNADAIVHLYECDLSQRECIYETSDKVQEEIGKVDILVNNAGIVSGRKFLDCPDNLIERTINVNIMAHMWLAKKFLPPMIAANDGMFFNLLICYNYFILFTNICKRSYCYYLFCFKCYRCSWTCRLLCI